MRVERNEFTKQEIDKLIIAIEKLERLLRLD